MSVEFLTENQKLSVLTEVDNICRYTWCEGDFYFSFSEIHCDLNQSVCIVYFQMWLYEKGHAGNSDLVAKPATCKILSPSYYSHIIDSDEKWIFLHHEVYEQLTMCITQWEDLLYQEHEDLVNYK